MPPYQWNITTLYKRLKPFLQSTVMAPSSLSSTWYRIWLIYGDGTIPSDYPVTSAGFESALNAASSGDIIRVFAATISGDFIVPAGVAVVGDGEKTVFTGRLNLKSNSVLSNVSVTRTANSADDLIAIAGPATDGNTAYLFNVDASAVQSGAGDAVGLLVQDGDVVSQVCTFTGTSTSGSGYGVYTSGAAAGPATLTVETSLNATVTDVQNFSFDNPGTANYVIWKIVYPDDFSSLPQSGTFRGNFTLVSGSGDILGAYWLLIRDACGDYSYCPDFELYSELFSVGSSHTLVDNYTTTPSGTAYYFGVGVGADDETTEWRLNQLLWRPGAGGDDVVLWEPGSNSSGDPYLYWCIATGNTNDLDTSNGGTAYVYACQFDTSDTAGSVNYMQGDRGAWDVANYGARHASDWAAGDSHHAPLTLASDAGTVLDLSGQELSLDSQSANTVFAGPTSGGAADPTFRAVVAADLGTGTPDSTKFLRDDLTWQVPSGVGGGTVVWYDEGNLAGTASIVNVTGAGGTVSVSSGTATVNISTGGTASGGDSTYTAAYASRPAASNDGDLFLPSDGFVIERDTGAAWVPWGPLFPFTAPVSGDFAWINQGSATIDTTYGGIYLYAPALAGNSLKIRKKTAPSVPYVITAFMLPHIYGANYSSCGLCWRESSSGKIITFNLLWNGNHLIAVTKFNDATTFNSDVSYVSLPNASWLWLKIEDNNTNRLAHWSSDGRHYHQFYSEARTTFMTADEVGFYANANQSTYPAGMTLLSWTES